MTVSCAESNLERRIDDAAISYNIDNATPITSKAAVETKELEPITLVSADGLPDEAEHYGVLFSGCEVMSFDYKVQTPWEAERESAEDFYRLEKRGYRSIGIIANRHRCMLCDVHAGGQKHCGNLPVGFHLL